jgi:hypothetical protein
VEEKSRLSKIIEEKSGLPKKDPDYRRKSGLRKKNPGNIEKIRITEEKSGLGTEKLYRRKYMG